VAAAGLALLAAGVTGAALEWTWEIPGAFIPVVVAAALLAGPALGAGRPRPARTQRLLAVGVAVAGVAAVVAGGIALTTDAQLRLSRDAARDGDLQAASVEARRAAAIQPWAAAPRLQLALVYEEADPAAALRRAEEAVDRAGEDWRAWLVLTRLRAATGDRPRALVALRRTRELAPRLPGVRNLLGVRQEQP
jgi:Flp pilus assembly protein TadD